MASGKTLEKLRQFYAKTEAEVKRWEKQQERALSLLGTITNIAGRLPALEDESAYGALLAVTTPGLPQRLLAKQVAALDELIVQLQMCLEEMQAAVHGMERQAQQAQRMVQQDRSLTPAVCAAAAPPIPSVSQCLQGLDQIWRMHAEELRLKCALVEEVRYDTPEPDLRQLVSLFGAQPHLHPGLVRDLLYLVAATQEPRRF